MVRRGPSHCWSPPAAASGWVRVPKAFVEVAGRPMIEWSLDALRAAGIEEIVVALPDGVRGARGLRRRARRRDALGVRARGARRRAGRGARSSCTTRRGRSSSPTLFTRVVEALDDADCAIAAARVTDTVKEADGRRRRRHARPLAAVGGADAAGVPARGAGGGAGRRRRDPGARPPTTRGSSSAPAAPCASSSPRPRTSRSRRRTTCAWPT